MLSRYIDSPVFGSIATGSSELRAQRDVPRRFAHLVGETPPDYLTRWRMDLGAQRLRDTEDTVGAIADAVGYRSEYSFSRAFTRQRGNRPRPVSAARPGTGARGLLAPAMDRPAPSAAPDDGRLAATVAPPASQARTVSLARRARADRAVGHMGETVAAAWPVNDERPGVPTGPFAETVSMSATQRPGGGF